MMVKRIIALTAIVTLLTIGTITPRPARADTTGALELTGIAIGAYAAFLIVCTAIIYRTPSPEPQQLTDGGALRRPSGATTGVHLGRYCRQNTGDLTLLCW